MTQASYDTPIRTCVGCGVRAPQSDLVRFAAVGGVLTPGRILAGRGAYTCRRVECFEQCLCRARSFTDTHSVTGFFAEDELSSVA